MLTYADITGGMITVSKAYDRDTRAEKYPKSDAGVRKIPDHPQFAAVPLKAGSFGELVFPRNGHFCTMISPCVPCGRVSAPLWMIPNAS